MKIRLAVLFGGRSAEHEISIITGLQAIKALDPETYEVIPIYLALNGKWYTGKKLLEPNLYRRFSCDEEVTLLPDPNRKGFSKLPSMETLPVDVCLLCFHGQFGEDGCVQGLLELAGLPYTGPNVLGSALSMSKSHSKAIVKVEKLPVLPGTVVKKGKFFIPEMSYPLFVKPNHLGSSIGISKATNREELIAGIAKVFEYDDEALVEPYVENRLEINVAVLEGEASVLEIPLTENHSLSYEDKYLGNGTKATGGESQGMAGLSRVIDPSDIDVSIKKQVTEYALTAFEALRCSGVCRIDFMMDLTTNVIYFNEVNPIPGSLSYYLFPDLLYSDLLDRVIKGAFEKKQIELSLKREFGFLAL